MRKFKRIIALLSVFIMLVGCVNVSADSNEVKLYIDGVLQELKTPCFEENGIVYLPLVETFFKVGVYMEWSDNDKCYIGTGNNGEIRVYPGLDWAEVDWIPIELPGKVKTVNSVCMIPDYFIEDALKVEPAVYDTAAKSISFKFPQLDTEVQREFSIATMESSLPEGESLFRPEQLFEYKEDSSSDNSLMRLEKVAVEDMHFDEALEIETFKPNDGRVITMIYSVQSDILIDEGTFEAGDVGLMTFWARATKTTDESGTAKFRPCYEQLGWWQKAQPDTVSIGKEWKKYYLPMYSGKYTLKGGESHLTLSVGAKPQIIQIAEMKMINFNQDVPVEQFYPEFGKAYKGMEEDHLWRKHAWKRIEKYRKDDMVVRVRDKEGNPIENADVKIDMTENEFMFGIELTARSTTNLDLTTMIDQKEYEILDWFNSAVAGSELKWGNGQPWPDYPRKAAQMNNYFLDRGKRLRGHELIWPAVDDIGTVAEIGTAATGPGNVYTKEQRAMFMERRALTKAWTWRGMITEWDLVNEMHDADPWRTFYGTQLYSDVSRKIRAVDPKARLILNDTGMEGHTDRYEQRRAVGLTELWVKMRDEERASFDGAGIQGHCVNWHYPMGMYWEIEDFAKEFDTVSITEYDFHNTNEIYDANHMYDTVLAAFSHPQTVCFMVWGLDDGDHWRNDAPFYYRNWEPKPELQVWKDMMTNEYSTNLSGKTDENGSVKFRGYRGKYDVTVNVDGVERVFGFTITDSDYTERDNWIDVIFDGKELTATTPNPLEVYATRRVDESMNESKALAEFLAAGTENWIGLFDDRDQNGETLRLTRDGLQNTYHYVKNGGYMEYELCEKAAWGNISIDFRAPLGEKYSFKVLTSPDGKEWNEIYAGSSAEDKTIDFKNTLFIRIVSDNNDYMGISEVDIHAEK